MKLSKKELLVIKEEMKFWQALERILGWHLYGWTYKQGATFLIKGQWGGEETLNITGKERDQLVRRFSNQKRLQIIRGRKY